MRVLLEEGFEAATIATQGVRYLEDRKQMIWWSERSGWGHYYLYDKEGKLLNPITHGAWRASRIVDIDEEKGLLYFRGNGRSPERTSTTTTSTACSWTERASPSWIRATPPTTRASLRAGTSWWTTRTGWTRRPR